MQQYFILSHDHPAFIVHLNDHLLAIDATCTTKPSVSATDSNPEQSYPALGQAISALNIQLQVAHKLWQINPIQAQRSLYEAYMLSANLMQEIRQTVKTLNSVQKDEFQDSLTSRR